MFPYQRVEDGIKLITPKLMSTHFPKAWAYLKTYEPVLRAREAKRDQQNEIAAAPFDDHEWYRFGRHQNLDKQDIRKLIVAQTVPNLRVCYDDSATMYLNNVRVNGIVPAEDTDPLFLLGVLNAPVADFVFRRIAKVKAGGFYEANKQFIAPLPIPRPMRLNGLQSENVPDDWSWRTVNDAMWLPNLASGSQPLGGAIVQKLGSFQRSNPRRSWRKTPRYG